MKLDFKATCGECGFATEPVASEKTTTQDEVQFRHEALVCRECITVTYDKRIVRAGKYRGKYPKSQFDWGQTVLMPLVAIFDVFRQRNGVRSITFQDGSILECPRVKQCRECGSDNLLPLFSAPGLKLKCPSCGARALRF